MSSSPTPHPSRLPSSHHTPRPQLVPPPHPRYTALALWHLLSLDAPTVATLWTLFIARCSHLTLPWTALAAMFVAVWMIYAADRLLDARILDAPIPDARLSEPRISESLISPPHLEARHRFHHQHRSAFLSVILLSSFVLAALLHRTDPRALHLYVLLATLLAAWMVVIHSQPLLLHIRPSLRDTTSSPSPREAPRRPRSTRRLPKELAVGIFFPAAIFIPTLARTSPSAAAVHLLGWTANWLRPGLLPSALLFACICTLNCLCLYAWEHPAPRLQAHWTTRWATAHLTQLALSLLAASTIATLSLSLPVALPALACSVSTAALFALNRYRRRLSPLHLRAAADLVLLTPLFLLPFAR